MSRMIAAQERPESRTPRQIEGWTVRLDDRPLTGDLLKAPREDPELFDLLREIWGAP